MSTKISNLYFSDDVYLTSQTSSSYEIEQLSNSISRQFSNKLDIYTGGSISGNVDIMDASLSILSGNYVQTTSKVDMYGLKNAFIQADTNNLASYGRSSIGSKGFYVLSVIGSNSLKLSGNVDIPKSAYSRLWSISLSNMLNSQFSTISSIDGNIVTFKQAFDPLIKSLSSASEAQLIALVKDDDNAFYCPADATIGNTVMNFYGQHAEGGSVHAIAQYSHAEGRGSIAEGRYSHAEGNITTAGGAGAHSEGMKTQALGNRSHAEGESAKALATGSHAEGYYTVASKQYSHAEGYQTSAFGNEAHTEGYLAFANAAGAHAEGKACIASGDYAHAEGISSFSNEYAAHAEGCTTSAIGRYSHAEGLSSVANGLNSHAEGYCSIADGKGAHAEGGAQQVGSEEYPGGYASGEGAHAEGSATSAIGSFSHAEGYKTLAKGAQAHAEGMYTVASGHRSHAEGYETYATELYSHADGCQTSALAESSYASGNLAVADSKRQYVWNGTTSKYDPSAGQGTFCINPTNGSSGFYIGSQNLDAIIADKASAGQEVKTVISNALTSAGIQADSALSNILLENVLSVIHNLQTLLT